MDAAELSPLIDQLEVQIDDLRDALEPLLATALSHHTTKLPLLDKAKLYVLVTYAIESLLFCTYGPPDTAHI
jgi:exosome complex protein LRP1